MFNVYFDDSGTSPNQNIAIASAIIIPACLALHLDREWSGFCDKYGVTDFHCSECASEYRGSQRSSKFKGWDDAKVERAFKRAARLTTKYGIRAFSFAVTKKEYEEEIPPDQLVYWAKDHYAHAIRRVLRFIWKWAGNSESRNRLEYVFDSGDQRVEDEIRRILHVEESFRPGSLEGHYSFRKRREWAGLQCADVVAWTCYCRAREFFEEVPMNRYAKGCLHRFTSFQNRDWLSGHWTTRDHLRESVNKFKKIYGHSEPDPNQSVFDSRSGIE